MKNVYYWSPFFSNIATPKAVLNSVIALKKFSGNSYKPILINVIGEWDNYQDQIKKYNIEIIDLNLRKYFKNKKISGYFLSRYYQIKIFLLAFFPLVTLFKKKKPDITILHLVTSLPLFINYIFKINSKIILRISGLPKLNLIRKFFWRLATKKISIITTPTIATKKYLGTVLFSDKIFLLRDPIIKVEEIIKKRKKNKFNRKKNNIYIAIGRLTRQKNFLFLLKCFQELINKDKKIFLYILGEGENFQEMTDFINKNNLSSNVFLEGYKENIYEYLINSKAFILSSLWEDPGFVLIEAGFSNTTIISSNCKNGPVEILNNSKNGYLFNSNDKKSFLDTINIFENDDENTIYRKKVEAKKMSRKFSLFNHYNELNKLLQNL